MTKIQKQFYRIFWENEFCQNLFLLSKDELLETHEIGEGDRRLICKIRKANNYLELTNDWYWIF